MNWVNFLVYLLHKHFWQHLLWDMEEQF